MLVPTLAQILAIPGNQAVYDHLGELLAKPEATAFVGAGASYPLYPLWPQLIEQLAQEPVKLGLASGAVAKSWLRIASKKPPQAVSKIREKPTDPIYYKFLLETFQDRAQLCTPAHSALMRMNFKAYLTTNYDNGLIEARGNVRPSGFTIWNQYEAHRWLSEDIFRDGPRRVLFAHGHYADAPNIVLDSESYSRAYHRGPYRRLFENLWLQQRLVFVGFSFNDATLGQIANEVFSEVKPAGVRHIAILALETEYKPEMRRNFLKRYRAEVLFYTVKARDHSALGVLLESLVAGPAEGATPARHIPSAATRVVRFVHETTEDKMFTGRADVLERLDRWAADRTVRLIAITGIGGLGKTALIGRWLRQLHRNVFFWSFYRERKIEEFLRELKEFVVEGPTVLALDGLEVIQEAPGTVEYGKLLEIDLAEFLWQHCRDKNDTLIVLTSRFPFPDLTQYLGRGMLILSLPSLDAKEGAVLLGRLGVRRIQEDAEEISQRLEGHPLALRIRQLKAAPPAARRSARG